MPCSAGVQKPTSLSPRPGWIFGIAPLIEPYAPEKFHEPALSLSPLRRKQKMTKVGRRLQSRTGTGALGKELWEKRVQVAARNVTQVTCCWRRPSSTMLLLWIYVLLLCVRIRTPLVCSR